MKCRNCGTDNPDSVNLCEKCGAALPTLPGPKSLIPSDIPDIRTYAAFVLVTAGLVTMVLGAWMIGTSGTDWPPYWNDARMALGIFLALVGAIILVVVLVVASISVLVPGWKH